MRCHIKDVSLDPEFVCGGLVVFGGSGVIGIPVVDFLDRSWKGSWPPKEAQSLLETFGLGPRGQRDAEFDSRIAELGIGN